MAGATYHTLGLPEAAEPLRLPRGMLWVDEFDWTPVATEQRWGTNGAQHLHIGVRQAGRPITLRGDENAGWIRRGTLDALRAMAAEPGVAYVLELADGREFAVMFAPDAPIDETRPVGRPELPTADNPYVTTLRLIEIGADEDDQDPEP